MLPPPGHVIIIWVFGNLFALTTKLLSALQSCNLLSWLSQKVSEEAVKEGCNLPRVFPSAPSKGICVEILHWAAEMKLASLGISIWFLWPISLPCAEENSCAGLRNKVQNEASLLYFSSPAHEFPFMHGEEENLCAELEKQSGGHKDSCFISLLGMEGSTFIPST